MRRLVRLVVVTALVGAVVVFRDRRIAESERALGIGPQAGRRGPGRAGATLPGGNFTRS